jgi:Predicted kinase
MTEPPAADDLDSPVETDEFSRFVRAVGRWVEALPGWPPARAIEAAWRGVEPRLTASLEELGRPLVVGVLGGTGTGKSTLVNALAAPEYLERESGGPADDGAAGCGRGRGCRSQLVSGGADRCSRGAHRRYRGRRDRAGRLSRP